MIVGVSGHRPSVKGVGGYTLRTWNAMLATAQQMITEDLDMPNVKILTGMAQGWDTAVAYMCLRHSIPYIAYVPFKGQEALWTENAQRLYHKLLDHAEKVIVVEDAVDTDSIFSRKNAYRARDLKIIEHSNTMCVLYNEAEPYSGTGTTVRLARNREKPISNYWYAYRYAYQNQQKPRL